MRRRIKFGLGGLDVVNTALSLASTAASIYNAAEAKADQRTAKNTALQLANKSRLEGDANFLKDFDRSGANVEFYKRGGAFNLNTRKIGNLSNFKPIAPNTYEVVGPSHERGGVKMGDKEVEGGEVVKVMPGGVAVLSDNKDYFGYSPAENAKYNPHTFEQEFMKQESIKPYKVDGKKAKDGMWSSLTPLQQSSLRASLPDTDKPMKINDTLQGLGANYDVDNISMIDPTSAWTVANMFSGGEEGGSNTYGGAYNMLPNLLDNVGNIITTALTPRPIPPNLVPHARLHTDVDVNPMLDAVRSGERSAAHTIGANISDSNVAAAMGVSAGNAATHSRNEIFANKANMESQIKNKQAEMRMQTDYINAGLIGDFQREITNRRSGINQAVNANIANLSADLVHMQDLKRMDRKDFDRMSMQLAADTHGSLSELVKSGALDYMLTDKRFNADTTHGATRQAAIARKAMLEMQRKSGKK